jgi:hypothetical protein
MSTPGGMLVVSVLAAALLAVVAVATRYDRIAVAGSAAVPQRIGYLDRWTGRVCVIRGAWLRCYCTMPSTFVERAATATAAGSASRAVAHINAQAAGGNANDLFAGLDEFKRNEQRRAADDAAAAAACVR